MRSRDLAQLILNRGSVYWKKGDYDRALTEFDEAVRLNPKHAETYYWRGLAYVSKQDYDRAIAEYTTAIKRDPKDAEFHLRRCEAYSAKRDFDRALADCNEGCADPRKNSLGAIPGAAWSTKAWASSTRPGPITSTLSPSIRH